MWVLWLILFCTLYPEDVLGSRVNTTDRLRRLRLRMKAMNYEAYIVPSIDEHQSGSVSDHDNRREFISGFTGSAGTAIILSSMAALWTDGRYFIQAEKELDCNWLLMKRDQIGTPQIDEWIIQNLISGENVGADPKLIPYNEWLYLEEKLKPAGISLLEDSSNLVDDIWDIPQGRTPESIAHVFVHDIKYAGRSWEKKVGDLRKIFQKKSIDGTIVTALDEIAWLFNLRGSDVPNTPLFKAYAFVGNKHIRLYIKPLKLTPDIIKYLCPKTSNDTECVQIEDYAKTFTDMKNIIIECEKVLLPSSSSYAALNLVPEDKRLIDDNPSPISTLKVVKNSVEIEGMKNAALKDSIAIVDFIAMLDQQIQKGKHWDEIKAAETLLQYRREQKLNQGQSFDTISASGSNGAIIHYHPQTITNRNINSKSMYLLDSGGQYLDGTTDITRTFHFGEPSELEVAAYTRVLMGAIDLISTTFPETTKDHDLDIIARLPLYKMGLDYTHGTGHGIGSFLGVHEGPISISGSCSTRRGYTLLPGMFLSDEPGYYEKDKFGVRIENMMMVVKANTPYHFNNKKYYTFEPVSFVPFEPKLIDLSIMSKKQKEWLNWFNMKSRNTVGIELQKQGRQRGLRWLLSKTEFVSEDSCSNDSTSFLQNKAHLTLSFILKLLCVLCLGSSGHDMETISIGYFSFVPRITFTIKVQCGVSHFSDAQIILLSLLSAL
ncbi:hypothetical protein JTE90_011938 [Oedothorax gibbosus]|uniref:Xaa-Pro aminopeptidase 1 n=1 Tax=Oedothorax gibbosus TaxID=931172 RepID=A0AAV6V2E3_9ARAC|nr:hypothetical protein JTE90_011938 [Oedothorax gibbosus]